MEEKELQKCSFHPNTNKVSSANDNANLIGSEYLVKGFEK